MPFLDTVLGKLAATFFMAMLPVVELRGAIPFGVAAGLPPAEAFAAAAEWALYKVHLSRVRAKCYKENQASYKMLASCMRRSGEDETFYYFEKLV